MDELTLALELADISDEIAMKYYSHDPESSIKQDGTLVTVADREIEQAVRIRIKQQFPGHSILGEESGMQGGEDAPTWVIDPIDGTNNFAAGIPIFGTLIALRVEGRTVVGVASGPALGERYEAAESDGARLNGKPIHVSGIESLDRAVVCIGSYRRMARYGYKEQLDDILNTCRRDRGFGDFWGYMLVARGAAEVMAEPRLKIWDVAALEVIVREAGGLATGFSGRPYPNPGPGAGPDTSFLCTNGLLHPEMVRRLGGPAA